MWFKATQMHCLIVLEAGSTKPTYRQGHTLSDGSRGNPSLPLPVSDVCYQSLAYRCITPVTSLSSPCASSSSLCMSVSLSKFPPFLRKSIILLGPNLMTAFSYLPIPPTLLTGNHQLVLCIHDCFCFLHLF